MMDQILTRPNGKRFAVISVRVVISVVIIVTFRFSLSNRLREIKLGEVHELELNVGDHALRVSDAVIAIIGGVMGKGASGVRVRGASGVRVKCGEYWDVISSIQIQLDPAIITSLV